MEATTPAENIGQSWRSQAPQPVDPRLHQVALAQLQQMLPEVSTADMERVLWKLFCERPSPRSFEACAAIMEVKCRPGAIMGLSPAEVVEVAACGQVDQLRDFTGNLDQPDENGEFPLTVAAAKGRGEMVHFFIQNGCDCCVRNSEHRSAEDLALLNGYTDLARRIRDTRLAQHKFELGQYLRAVVAERDIDEVIAYLDSQAPVDQYDAIGDNALHMTARLGDPEILVELVKKTSNINLRSTRGGSTPLHIAVEAGHWACVKILVENRADWTLLDAYGRTARNISCLTHSQMPGKLSSAQGLSLVAGPNVPLDDTGEVIPNSEDEDLVSPRQRASQPPLSRRRTDLGEAHDEVRVLATEILRRNRGERQEVPSDDERVASSPSPNQQRAPIDHPLLSDASENLPPTAPVGHSSPNQALLLGKRKSPSDD